MLHGYITPHRFFPYLAWTDVQAMPDKENTVIVLPVAALEQHGPHLPIAVDSIIAEGIVGKALERLDRSIPAYALETVCYGKSDEHIHFPGTLTLTGPTLLATVTEIGESVYRAGFKKLLIVNGHGGQPQVMEMAARELRIRHGDYVVIPHFTWRVPNVAGTFLTAKEKALSMHAGHAETAILLALAPATVHMDRAQSAAQYPPEFPSKTLSADGRPAAAWTARDFGPNGVIGDPAPATLEHGEKILESLAVSWAKAIEEVHRMQWVTSPDGPIIR